MDNRSTGVVVPLVTPAAAGGADERLPELYRDHAPSLRLFFRQRLGNEADVEDALQDTYVRVLRYCSEEAIRSPQALLFRVAESVLQDRYRRQKSRRADHHVDLYAVEIADPLPDQAHNLGVAQELALLSQAIAQLTPKCRRVFLLSRLHNLTYPEIAAQLGVSVQMVAKHVSHALTMCRKALGEDAPGRSRQ